MEVRAEGGAFLIQQLNRDCNLYVVIKQLTLFFFFTFLIYCILQNGLLYTGGEDRNITAWDIKSGKVAYCFEEAHPIRVKGLVVLKDSDGSAGDDEPYLVASASSDGIIRIWDIRGATKEKPLAEYKTQSRLTCLAGTSLRCKL